MPELTAEQEALLQEELQRISSERARAAELARHQGKSIEDLIIQIQAMRGELEERAARLQELTARLRSEIRKSSELEGAHHYTVFSTAHLRLAGAVFQVVRRTVSTDRLLVAARADREEAQRRDERERQYREAQARRKAVEHLQISQEDDFESIYGEIV
jgi:hypothetical protein